MEHKIIKIRDFSISPGARYRDEGEYSGEEYREGFLKELFSNNNQKIIIDLDGTIGYGTSWLEEVFGGLAREFGVEEVLDRLSFISKEEPYLIEDIKNYISSAKK